jgi:non-specific serine/threonine protein kinase
LLEGVTMPNGEDSSGFGSLLRQYRIAAGLTQEVLAERTGLGVRSIQHLEGGTHLPHRETIDRLIKGLGLSGEGKHHFERAAQPAPRQREAGPDRVTAVSGDHLGDPRGRGERAMEPVATFSETFGDLLRRYRLAAGLTQEELAARAQVSPRAISDLERGARNRPWRETIQLLATALRLGLAEQTELEAAARRASPGAPQTIGSRPRDDDSPPQHNLPAPLTSFVGREREMAELKERLRTTRLLTLTGVGGYGKTRLALRVGVDLLDTFPDGVWLVELAPVGDPAFLAPTFARALGVAEEPPTPILRTLLGALRSRRVLLLVDNCEHLIAACAELIETLLRTCPNLTVLATSREALGLAGEVAWRVPSLPLPPRPPDAGTPRPSDVDGDMPVSPRPGSRAALLASWVKEVGESSAVQLFVDRAQTTDPAFAVTPANATAVAQICWRLDGIPLALELAAARLKVLNVGQIADRLDDRFRLLTGGTRTALPRQQTLRATLDWSYHLLSELERRTLRRLSIFSSSCTLEAAEAVCQDTDVLDRLSQLVDKSLVLVDKDATEPRYGMLETIRQYGRDRLVEDEEAREAREQHRDWFLVLAERAAPELLGARQVEWLSRLEAENDNLRAAIEWSLAAAPEVGARLAGHLWQFWYFRARIFEGIRWLDAALAVAPRGKALHAKLLAAQGLLLREHDEVERSRACSEEALSLCERMGDNVSAGWALNNLGTIVRQSRDHVRGRALLEESVRRFQAAGDRAGVGMGLRDLAVTAWLAYDDARARVLYEESLTILREIRDCWNLGWTLAQFSWVALLKQDYARARQMASESLTLSREIGNVVGMMMAQINLADVARLEGDLDRAQTLLMDLLVQCQERETGPAFRTDRCLLSLGKLAVQRGDARRGVVLIGPRKALGRGDPRGIVWAENEASLAAARSVLGEETFARALAEGEALTRAQAIAYALRENGDG